MASTTLIETLETRTPLPLTYEATGTPPATALFADAATEAAPTASSGPPAEGGWPRSRPSACWALSAPAIAVGVLAEQVARVGEVVVLEAQQAGDRAAGDEAVGEGARHAALA